MLQEKPVALGGGGGGTANNNERGGGERIKALK
jgi:hypothetical protein